MLLEEFLNPLGLTQRELADAIQVPYQRINEIVNGRRSVTPSTALRLAKFFGMSADFWINLQLRWDLYHTQQAIHAYCRHHPPENQHVSCEVGKRSRLEQRTVRLWALSAGTDTHPWHDHFPVVIEVVRHTECFNTARKCWVPRQEQPAYYLCTISDSAQALAHLIRDHWAVENRLHHVLDTALDEDACRIRRNPGIFALIRHFALNLLRHNGKDNINATLYDNALSLDRLLAYEGI